MDQSEFVGTNELMDARLGLNEHGMQSKDFVEYQTAACAYFLTEVDTKRMPVQGWSFCM